MSQLKSIITHILHGFVQLAELFDRSVTSLINELDSSKAEEAKTKK